MPLYEYKCSECTERFSYRHSYKELMVRCEVCETDTLEKYLGNSSNFIKKATKKKNHKVSVEQEIERFREELKKDKDERLKDR